MEIYDSLKKVVTPKIDVRIVEKEPLFNGTDRYMDADDEMKELAKYIKVNTTHNSNITPERIKYFYTTKPVKDGGRFVAGGLQLRTETEKLINSDYDYILCVFYKVWVGLDIENKLIHLDKILCGVDGDDEKLKKKAADSKEYMNNLRHFGAEKVLDSSEMVDIAVSSIIEKEKEEKKNAKNDSGDVDHENEKVLYKDED